MASVKVTLRTPSVRRYVAYLAMVGRCTDKQAVEGLGMSRIMVSWSRHLLIEKGLVEHCGTEEPTGGRPPSLWHLTPAGHDAHKRWQKAAA